MDPLPAEAFSAKCEEQFPWTSQSATQRLKLPVYPLPPPTTSPGNGTHGCRTPSHPCKHNFST